MILLKTEDVKVVILAGGLGTRIREISDNVPKVMLPVGGKPFLEYIISNLRMQGFRQVILSVGYKSERIEDYFRDGSWLGVTIEYSKEAIPLGTGGALIKALDLIANSLFLAMNGDSYFNVVFRTLVEFHKSKKSLCTIYLREQNDKGRYGLVLLDSKSRIAEFHEKPIESESRNAYINAGVYCLEKAIFTKYPFNKYISIEETIFPEFAHTRKMYGIIGKGTFIDIGVPNAYKAAEKIFKTSKIIIHNE